MAAAALGPGADVRAGDALDGAVPAVPFDVVVGNPPFLNQLAAGTSRGGRSRWGGGAYADTAALFLSLALHAARPDGGRVGLVLPHSILATRDTAPIRAAALAGARLDALWWAGESVFDADVLTCVVAVVRGEPQGAVRRAHGPRFDALPDAAGHDLGPAADVEPPLRRRRRHPDGRDWATASLSVGWPRPRPTSATSTTGSSPT